jgi:tetratricopeptide (TPR) repeat protein
MESVSSRSFLRPPLVLLLLPLITTIIYSNSFSSPFLFDDYHIILNDLLIKDLSNFLHSFGFRYVGFLTFALNYHFGRLNPFGYHLVNLLIHLINGGLVFLLVRLLFHTPRLADGSSLTPSTSDSMTSWIALTTAALFLVHPVQTEAVTYIVQRFTSLAALFYLLTVVCYLRWRISPLTDRRQYLWYGAALLSTLLAMTTKETTFTLPFMLLLIELVFFGLPSRRGWLGLLPFFLTLPVIPLSRPYAMGNGVAGFASETTFISRPDYLFTQFRVIVTYLRLLVLPIQQNLDYDYPVYHSLFQLPVLVSFLALLGLGGSALWLLLRPGPVLSARAARSQLSARRLWRPAQVRGSMPLAPPDHPHGPYAVSTPQGQTPFPPSTSRLAAFGVLWFFLTLSIESSIIPIRDVIYEHRLYLPSVGLFLAASALLFGAAAGRGLWNVAAVAVGLVVVILAIATYQRNAIWQSTTALWQDVVRKSPGKARGHSNLGASFADQQQWTKALSEYQIALTLPTDQQTFTTIQNNMGNAYLHLGQLDAARQAYTSAITAEEASAPAHNGLGNVYNILGHNGQPAYLRQAMQEYETASRLNPDFAEPYYNLGNLYRESGRLNTAMEYYRSALQRNPNYALAWNNLGLGYYVQGKLPEALDALKKTTQLKPYYVQAHNNLGVVYNAMGQPQNALREFQAAITLKPDYIDAYHNLGKTYAGMGRIPQAIQAFEQALQINPNDQQAHRALTALGR